MTRAAATDRRRGVIGVTGSRRYTVAMATCLVAVAIAAPLLHLMHSRDRRYRRHEAARQLRRAERERQWRAMIRGDDETTAAR